MKRILLSVGVVVLIFGSLITFPAHLHWMAFVWVSLSIIAFGRSRPMWPWLLGGALIIAFKRPGFTIEFWILSFVFALVAYMDWRFKPRTSVESSNRRRLAVYGILLIAATSIYGRARWVAANTSTQLISDGRPIACLGDSLTDYGYPQELEKLISVPVADFGVNGIKTDDGIKMIPKILASNPQLVVIELGGHDYNGGKKPRSATKLNLEKLIETFLQHEIAVILIEIPRGFVTDPYDGLERELAAKYDLQLIDDSLIRSFVFNSPVMPPGVWRDPSRRYSNDGLHPNGLGNEHFARVVQHSLTQVFGDSILK